MTVVSKKLRASAGHPDAHCMVNVAGVCGDDTEAKTAGCMLAHWRFSGNAGGGQKPDDFCGGFACGPCHTVFAAVKRCRLERIVRVQPTMHASSHSKIVVHAEALREARRHGAKGERREEKR